MKCFLLLFLAVLMCEAPAPPKASDPHNPKASDPLTTKPNLPSTPAQQPTTQANINVGGKSNKAKSSELPENKSKKKSSSSESIESKSKKKSSSSESIEIELTCDDCGLSVNLAQNETFFALITSLEANFLKNSTEYQELEALRRIYNLYAYNYTSIEVQNSSESHGRGHSKSDESLHGKGSNEVVIPYVKLDEQVRCSAQVTELLPTILKNQYCPYIGPVPRLSSSESSESHGKSSESHGKSNSLGHNSHSSSSSESDEVTPSPVPDVPADLLSALRTIHDQIYYGNLDIRQCNDCIDVEEVDCVLLASNGTCESNIPFMQRFCRNTCQYCDCKHPVTRFTCPDGFVLETKRDFDEESSEEKHRSHSNEGWSSSGEHPGNSKHHSSSSEEYFTSQQETLICRNITCNSTSHGSQESLLDDPFDLNKGREKHIAACLQQPSNYTLLPPPTGPVGGFNGVHDPSILRTCDGTYIVYGTKSWVNEVSCPGGGTAPALLSYDRYTFFNGGFGFPNGIPTLGAFDGCDSVVWAPDTQLVNGTYYMYYSGAKFGDKCSIIGVATSATGYPGTWFDLGKVFDSCSAGYNAIDPNLLVDTDGRWYLTFGSFFAGIYSVELDPATAKLKPGAPFIKVASRNLLIGNAIEGPFVFKKGPFYYLFVAWDYCCRGVDSNYRIMYGRATAPQGPFFDRAGVDMAQAGGTELLGTVGPIIGPGGVSVYADVCHDLFVYHYYDGNSGGAPRLAINYLGFTADGWPYLY